MSVSSLVSFLLVGLIAGWLAGKIMRGSGFGFLGNMVIGVVGAFVGGFVFQLIGLTSDGLFGFIITATVGAVIFLFIAKLIRS